jgi:hypothetical protein
MKTIEKHQVIKRALSLLITLALAFVINAGITYAGKYLFKNSSNSTGQPVTVASVIPLPPPPPPPVQR